MAELLLDILPAELQLMIFRFAYSDCEIKITERKNDGEGDTATATTAGGQEHILIPERTDATARQAYLTHATWCFSSMAAARGFFASHTSRALLQHIRHIRIDAREVDPARLLLLLSRAGCGIRSVELINCTAFDFGLPHHTSDVFSSMQRNETEVMQHIWSRSCRASDAATLSWQDLDESLFVMALAGIPTLEHVAIRVECEVCAENGIECDWRLLARKAELCVLQAVALHGRASRRRLRNIARIEQEVKALEDAALAREGMNDVDVDSGKDWELDLESDEELVVLVG